MRKHGRQSGLTLTELVVAVAIAAVLLALAVPAVKRLTASLQGTAGTQGLINAALSNARAIAVREQKYAGVRFQWVGDRTYLVFVINDEVKTGRVNGFRAVDGRKAIGLPENTGVGPGYPFSIVFSPSGKLVTHRVRFVGKLPIMGGMDWDDGDDLISVNSFWVYDTKDDTNIKGMMVSPYTGELIGN